jgi:hypothetical protein
MRILKDLKFIVPLMFLAVVLFGSSARAAAPQPGPQADWRSHCEGGEGAFDDPHPLAIMCPIARILRIFVYSAAIVFVAVMGFGGWKISLSLGDPKALMGGQQTWTYAVLGLFVVLGFFAAFSIVAGLLGIESIVSPDYLVDRIANAIASLYSAVGIDV